MWVLVFFWKTYDRITVMIPLGEIICKRWQMPLDFSYNFRVWIQQPQHRSCFKSKEMVVWPPCLAKQLVLALLSVSSFDKCIEFSNQTLKR